MNTKFSFSKNVKRQFLLLFFATSTMLISSGCSKDDDAIDPLTTEAYIKFAKTMQKVWADHQQWTYATVDAYFNDPSNLQPKLDRLLKNQEDIGATIVPYYGQAAGNQLTALLKEHIAGAVPVLAAAQSGDQAALTTAVTNWRANAKEIADFLSAANPQYWEQSNMRESMDMHITQTIAYSVDLLQQNYSQSIINYDIAFDHMMMKAKDLSEGIAKQFPDKFKSSAGNGNGHGY